MNNEDILWSLSSNTHHWQTQNSIHVSGRMAAQKNSFVFILVVIIMEMSYMESVRDREKHHRGMGSRVASGSLHTADPTVKI